MYRLFITLMTALLIAAGVGIDQAANMTWMPAIVAPSSGDTATPTFTPTVTSTAVSVATATHTPSSMPTATEQSQSGPCLCTGNLYNCSNFSTQPQAQACFNYCVQQGHGDVHLLDTDNDNIACES